ncbi:DUF3769 domain-containing protein [Myxosarcina sp. GI1]|uniref:DUF3769 domain-containing protein n=1 Tax=Myxosarcina sp. GI1 TaxID=1541065 RepID=UPI0009E01351|nr:DUF3769 domain-containing protein [Myxosarcina sp. GI1]
MMVLIYPVELPVIARSPIPPPPEVFVVDKSPELSNEIRIERNKEIASYPLNQTYLITQERQGERRQFEIPVTEPSSTEVPIGNIEVVEVIADRQEYDTELEVITAEGNVVMRFANSVLTGDRLEVNLADRIAVAQGNVVLTRGKQVLRGSKFEYYLVQDRGVVYDAGGQIDRARLNRDLQTELPPNPIIPDNSLSDRLNNNQPFTQVTSTEGVGFTIGSERNSELFDRDNNSSGTINRLRFEAERINFEPNSWQAQNFRLTNDPFSPPELELRADTATYQQVEPLVGKLTTTKSRVVIDDSFTLPLLANSFTFDSRPRQPGLFNLGFDGDDRGGLYVERKFGIINTENVDWTISPQYFLQRALFPNAFEFNDDEDGGIFNSSSFGVESEFNTLLGARTSLSAATALTSLDVGDLEDNLRARLTARQLVGDLNNPYNFGLEYNFRERLFNGSLGFQTVYSSFGGVVTSPNIAVGTSGINLRYQGSIQNITANTDREDLLTADRDNDRINLTRYQAAVFLNKGFSLWQGEPLALTPQAGLRYTPVPVVPYLQLLTGVTGVGSIYSNDETQLSLRGEIGIQGQFGHFSRSWLDYTGFRIVYSQSIRGDESPFLFDRDVDRQVLSLGISQQIYGPIRFGIQSAIELEGSDEISTDYTLEYSRRTFNVILRYNPVLEIGSIGLLINDFNWQGNARPFEENNISPVIQGVKR